MSAFGSNRVRRPVVVGFEATPIGRHPDHSPTELGLEALDGALARASLRPADLDGVYLVPEGYARPQAPLRPQRVAERLGVPTRACVEVENGGTSAMLALKAACQDVALGHLDVAAVVGGQAERRAFDGERDESFHDPAHAGGAPGTALDRHPPGYPRSAATRAPGVHRPAWPVAPPRTRGRGTTHLDAADLDRVLLLNAMYGPWLGPYGVLAALPCYALAAQRYLHDHAIPPELIAQLSVLLRANAARNPRAELREPISVQDVLASRLVSPPIHKLEAAPWSDGAAAVIVMSEAAARGRDLRGAALTGWGERHDASHFVPFGGDLTRYPWIGEATDEALGRAGRTREDLDLLEVYGAFAHAELMTYEAMGLFGAGEAPRAVAQGETALDGRIPINPSGGRLSMGHPPQATPLLMVGELYDQLTGAAGERQVAGAEIGVVQAEHGMMNGACVAVLEVAG